MRDLGEEVELAVLHVGENGRRLDFIRNFRGFPFPARLGISPHMKHWLGRNARSGEFSIIHNHSLWMMPNVYSCNAAKKAGIPLVVSPRGTLSHTAMNLGSPVKKLFWPVVQRPALQATTCFHATSESEFEDIRRLGFRQPVAIIPNGVDVPSIIERAPSSKRTLLYLGRIHPVKGIDNLLRAWKVVAPQYLHWNLRIVGPDDRGHLQKMRDLARNLKLDRVTFDGELLGDRKLEAYSHADLYVLPTHSENFGMTVAEALAAGTPVVVSKGAPWEGLEKAGAGWWIENGLNPLVACLEAALASPCEALHAMGERGRDWMRQDFSWPEIAIKTSETYRWILHGGNKPDWVIED
jgi:glycosyltransferase involved in cell wall biosynthesis